MAGVESEYLRRVTWAVVSLAGDWPTNSNSMRHAAVLTRRGAGFGGRRSF